MNVALRDDRTDWSLEKFGVGQPVPRSEDPRLVQGHGRYTDDLNVEGQVHAIMIRSTYAHGVIRKIDTTAAKGMPGVLGVYTGEDLKAAGYGPFKCVIPLKNRDGSPMHKPIRLALAMDKVRFVGDPIAFVVAETIAQAKDAAEAVEVDIEPLPAVTQQTQADKAGAPQIYDDVPNNVACDFHFGDSEKVKAAFAQAAHVTKLHIVNNRVFVSAMEPRAAIGVYDAAKEHWTLHVGCQGAFGHKAQLVDMLKTTPDKVRVLTGNVGGSFGMKAAVYPETVAVLHASKLLGRPVKWTADRSESFLSDHAGRDHEFEASLALDKDGNFLAWKVEGCANMGAYLGTVSPLMGTMNVAKNMMSLYRTPAIEVSTKCVFTNMTFVSAYRGAGRPEGNYFMERLIDRAAVEMGIDRVKMRRRNMIKPKEMPHTVPSGMVYDSGDFPAVLDKAIEVADWKGFDKRKRESKKHNKLRGRGVGCYLEVTGPPQKEMGGIRFETDGTVTFITGTLDYGQGHATPFAQVLTQQLGIPFERIRLLQGDSDELIAGGGTGGSRSAYASSTAAVEASAKVIEKGKQIAGHMLEAAASDIEFADGRFVISGTDRAIGIMDIAERLRKGVTLPEGVPSSLDVKHVTGDIPSAFPNGCHVAEVEVDMDTGQAAVVRYAMVNDFGTVINPMLVEGQCHGGVVQGIGQAFLEQTAYDEDGQLLTGSYMDYAMPRAHDAPDFKFFSHPVPAKSNPLGIKGCGEAGCAGGLTSVMNALCDAFAEYGITNIDMPATPERLWHLVQKVKAAKGKAA